MAAHRHGEIRLDTTLLERVRIALAGQAAKLLVLRRVLAALLLLLGCAAALWPPGGRAEAPPRGEPAAERASVLLRLADPATARMLFPGAAVDVLTTPGAGRDSPVLARKARVVEIDRTDPGEPAIVVRLPEQQAAEVAAAAMSGRLTVTLR